MELSDIIAHRRSIRKFRQEDISADTVRLLLDAARLAPSGSNLQPARFNAFHRLADVLDLVAFGSRQTAPKQKRLALLPFAARASLSTASKPVSFFALMPVL